jgi:G6PDH family F420-dependent oxidoreductase
VHDAKIFSRPPESPLILVGASGQESCDVAATCGDGLIATEPKAELVDNYLESGGKGPAYAQIAMCWAKDEAQARKTAHKFFRFSVPAWKVMAELPNRVNFAAATRTVREEDVAESIPCGPDPEKHIEGIKKFIDAGFEHIAVLQAGPDQEGFIRFWSDELKPRLGKLGIGAQEAAAPAAGRSSR